MKWIKRIMKNNLNKIEQKYVFHIHDRGGVDDYLIHDFYTTDFDKIVEKAYEWHGYTLPIEMIYMDNKSGKFKVYYTYTNIFEDRRKIECGNMIWKLDENYPWFAKSDYWKVKKALVDGVYDGGILKNG